MAILNLKKLFGSGGAGLAPNRASGSPSLRQLLAALINAVGGVGAPNTTWWETGITVTTNVATLASPGRVLAVEATAAASAGPKQQVQNGSPAAGSVDVAYSAAGVPTLTFNGTDAVTACAVQQLAGGGADTFTIES